MNLFFLFFLSFGRTLNSAEWMIDQLSSITPQQIVGRQMTWNNQDCDMYMVQRRKSQLPPMVSVIGLRGSYFPLCLFPEVGLEQMEFLRSHIYLDVENCIFRNIFSIGFRYRGLGQTLPAPLIFSFQVFCRNCDGEGNK